MNTRRLDHVGVAVRDAARARAFYEGVLGLEALSEEIVAPMRLKIVKLRAGDATI
jgi:catechol 2,3-dioxygenase-like lactoylglutathione lyase family enzyme